MSKLKQIIKEMAPKKGKSRALLLEFTHSPEVWHWLERQAAVQGCSKTTYVKALIEQDRIKEKKSV